MAKPKSKRKANGAKLTTRQVGVVQKFNNYSFENPNLTFEQVSLKELCKKFAETENGKLFGRECHKVFDREREA